MGPVDHMGHFWRKCNLAILFNTVRLIVNTIGRGKNIFNDIIFRRARRKPNSSSWIAQMCGKREQNINTQEI